MVVTLAPRTEANQSRRVLYPRKVEVRILEETAYDYKGIPTHNPNCPILTWPKFAWVEVDADY